MTAVEWFKENISHMIHSYDETELEDLFQQAKEMEKEQIIDACNYGDFEELGEQYYNKTYKKNNL